MPSTLANGHVSFVKSPRCVSIRTPGKREGEGSSAGTEIGPCRRPKRLHATLCKHFDRIAQTHRRIVLRRLVEEPLYWTLALGRGTLAVMTSAAPLVQRLDPARLDEAVDVFADAFAEYPVMRFTVGDDGDVAARERRLVRLFVTRRVRRGGPMLGVRGLDGSLVAAAVLTLPVEPEPPPDVAQISADAWRDLGDAARLRYDAYTSAANFFGALPPHHHLNMIGVRRAHAGTGLGRVLLDAVRTMAEEDSSSAGVSLTTENPRNVEIYRHVGFDVIGHRVVSEYQPRGQAVTLETWGMFAPRSR